jgi:iron complex transport system ATP-binding protein
MDSDASLIEMTGVSIERETTRILDRVSLSIPQKQHVAIVGPNGSGKSTLLKLLMKFFYPSVIDGQSGTVRILGQEEWNVWELRSHLGFVSSDIDHHFTLGRSGRLNAIQTVLTGYFSAELELDQHSVTDAMRSESKRLLERFQLCSQSSKCIGHMSTGERRRVLLARALVRRPQAIVLDEPTTGLDIRARVDLLVMLNELACTGTQIVLVTHHLEEILPCIDRTILLKAGKVFRDARTNEALSEDSISALFDTTIQIDRDAEGFFHPRIR